MKMSAMLKLKGAFVIFFFFLPGNLITMHCLGTFHFIPENTKKDGKRRGSRILKTCVSIVLLNVCVACVMTPVDIQK